MGKIAAELLLQVIKSKRPAMNFEKRILLPELKVTDSSAEKDSGCSLTSAASVFHFI